jgi:3-dehydroquinate dehydratase type I
MKCKACLSVMIQDDTNIDTLMEHISFKNPDLVEIRLDKLHERKPLEEIAKKRSFPIIATDRSDRGQLSKLDRLSDAIGFGFDIVDIELPVSDAVVKRLKSEGAEVILSFHDYSHTPSRDELCKVLETEKRLGGDICKVVTTARLLRDNLTILELVESERAKGKLISFAMGKQGVPSRILSPIFGAEFTFAALEDDLRTAEGQLTIDELRSAWGILGIW